MKFEEQKTRNAIILKMHEQGRSQQEIAEAVGLKQARISQLLNAFRQSPDTFYDNRYQGKPMKMDAGQLSKLDDILKKGAEAYGFQGDVWTSPRVQAAIRETFGIEYHVRHVPRLLKAMGYTLQKPRLVDRRQAPEKVEGWLKERLPAIKKKLGTKTW